MSQISTFLDKLVESIPAKVASHTVSQENKKSEPNAEKPTKVTKEKKQYESDDVITKNDFKKEKTKVEKKVKNPITNGMFNFMKGWEILIDKIPKYPEFENQEFTEKVDRKILVLLLKDNTIADEQKLLLSKLIERTKNDTVSISHFQLMKGNDVGRFYPQDNISIISLCKKVKHTMFKYLGYTDFDMVSCHQSIALSIAEKNSIKLPAIFGYMYDKENIMKDEIEHYSIENSEPISTDDIKYKFNMMAYGGSEETWRRDIEYGYDDFKPRKINDKESKFTKEFRKDVQTIQQLVYNSNKPLFEKIYTKYDDMLRHNEIEKNKRTLLSCFFQIVENHILFITFKQLQFMKVIHKTNVCLEFDGLCVPTNKFNKEKVITELNKKIVELTGLQFIKFKIKDYPHAIDEVVEKRKSIEAETHCVTSDLDAAKKFTDCILIGIIVMGNYLFLIVTMGCGQVMKRYTLK